MRDWRAFALLFVMAGLSACNVAPTVVQTTDPVNSPVSAPTPPPTPTPIPIPTPAPTPTATCSQGTGKFVYTGNSFIAAPGYGLPPASIAGFSMDPLTGALNPLSGFPLSFGTTPYFLAVDQKNHHLISGDQTARTLTVFCMDGSTGALGTLSNIQTPGEPAFLLLDPSGTHLYVTQIDPFQVVSFSLSSAGVLTPVPGGSLDLPYEPIPLQGVAIDAAGSALYVLDVENYLHVISLDGSGLMNEVQSIQAGASLTLALDPGGSMLYAAGSRILAYKVDAASGMLTPAGSSTPAGSFVFTLAISPTGKSAYTVEGTTLDSDLRLYEYSLSRGSFHMIGSEPSIVAQQIGFSFSALGNFVYVPMSCTVTCPNGVYGLLHEYSADPTGVLTELEGSPVSTGQPAQDIVVTQ